jgi:GcrA cell cycle regulator
MKPHGNQTWTDQEDAQLLALERQGLSGSLIGQRLGKSKAAVIGRSHRLRGYKRQGVHTQGVAAMPRQTKVTVRKLYQLAPKPDSGRRLIGIIDLDQNTCRWPFGERAPFRFCGAPPASVHTPYCALHFRLGFK